MGLELDGNHQMVRPDWGGFGRQSKMKSARFQALSNSFSRSQIASAIATAVDYLVLFGLTELVHVWYVASVAIGAAVAAVVNFLINRYWSFESASLGKMYQQAWRYSCVSTASLLLNSGGVYAVTEFFGIHYAFSVIVVSAIVGWFFNYPLHRYYVFRSEPVERSVERER